MRCLFLSHGGGPLPLLGDPAHTNMVEIIERLAGETGKPDAVIVISAHWEEKQITFTSGKQPGLIYDYWGFEERAYSIKYPCHGSPALSRALSGAFTEYGIENSLDEKRGFDHGVFVPLKLMYPDADVPCVEMSLLASLNAAEHLEAGRALGHALSAQQLEKVLIIGSGFSFHNMKAFFTRDDAQQDKLNLAFEAWLKETLMDPVLTPVERETRLLNWQSAPGARFCHPREEHLLPLMVCYGAMESAPDSHYSIELLGKQASFFVWQ